MRLAHVKCLAVTIVFMLLIVNGLVFQVQAAEPTLTEVLSTLGFTNIGLSSAETFESGTYNITLFAEFAAYNYSNELSYYEVGSSVYELIFSGPEGMFGYVSPPITKTFSIPAQFGLSMYTIEGHRYFTENLLNPDGQNHSKIYLNLDNPDMCLIGFENRYGAGDRDYQDLVFSIEKTQTVQYHLTVDSDYGISGGEGLYDAGTNTYAFLNIGTVDHGNGTKHIFTHWSGDASGTDHSQSDPILMDQNKTAIANWRTEMNVVTAADFTHSPPSPEMLEDVTFDASASNGTIVGFVWDFGDGSGLNTTDPVVVHQFTGFGVFNVTLTVVDSEGGSDTLSELITVKGVPTAAFTYSPLEPHALEEVTFDASGSQPNGGSIVSYAWDFGDGSGNTSSVSTMKHTYLSPGDYNVTLTVTDNEGLSETVWAMIIILPGVQHDIALMSVTTNTPHEYAGRVVNITITARNNGEVTESFDLKAYRNSTLIGTIHVTNLASGEETIVIVHWNTSYLIAGQNWTIKGEAVVVGDVTPADNVLVDGQVYIKMIGDVNADGTVDIFDIAAGALAFGSVEGESNWNPQADIAAEFGLVDVLDLVAILLHFGEAVEHGA